MNRTAVALFLRRHRWWIAPLVAAALLFAVLWWTTRGAGVPDYVYQPF